MTFLFFTILLVICSYIFFWLCESVADWLCKESLIDQIHRLLQKGHKGTYLHSLMKRFAHSISTNIHFEFWYQSQMEESNLDPTDLKLSDINFVPQRCCYVVRVFSRLISMLLIWSSFWQIYLAVMETGLNLYNTHSIWMLFLKTL